MLVTDNGEKYIVDNFDQKNCQPNEMINIKMSPTFGCKPQINFKTKN